MTEKLSAGVYTTHLASTHCPSAPEYSGGRENTTTGWETGTWDQHAAVVPDTAAAPTLMKLPVLMRRIKVMFVVRWVK